VRELVEPAFVEVGSVVESKRGKIARSAAKGVGIQEGGKWAKRVSI
jgi:hypothetical protein